MGKTDIDFEEYVEQCVAEEPELAGHLAQASERLDIALQLVKLREAMGLTQAELATRVGTSQQTISRLENPHYQRHSVRTLRRIADALDARLEMRIVPRSEKVGQKHALVP